MSTERTTSQLGKLLRIKSIQYGYFNLLLPKRRKLRAGLIFSVLITIEGEFLKGFKIASLVIYSVLTLQSHE